LENKYKFLVLYLSDISAAKLSLGSSMEKSNVKRGDDVYLECGVEANPRPHKVVWEKDGEPIQQDIPGGIILSNLSLVIQHISHSLSGSYRCKAYNTEGSAVSNTLPLTIQYEPVCKEGQEGRYLVPLNTRVDIPCEVMSHPAKDLVFHWVFNTSKEIIDIQQSDIRRVNDSGSVVTYIPRTKHDYGSLLCWAENSVGKQAQPCAFQLLPATIPDTVGNCRVQNVGMTQLEVSCQAGADGGLKQIFLLEVINRETGLVLSNQTSDIPVFTVTGVEPGEVLNMSIASYNSVGYSDKVYIQYGHTIHRPVDQAQTGTLRTQLIITPILGALIGVGAALGLVTLSIVLVMCCKKKTSNHGDMTGGEKDALAPDIIPSITGSKDDESGFEHYKQKNFSTLNNRSKGLLSNEETRHKNVFIVDPPSSCCGVGSCTTPTSVGPYNTLHPRLPHRDIHYSPISHSNCPYSHCNTIMPKRLHYSPPSHCDMLERGVSECGADMPLLASYGTLLPSSDLTQSDTDTSLLSSERDRESEV